MTPTTATANPLPVLELRDILLPAAPAWWPPAPGWWLLAGLLLLGLTLALRWFGRRVLAVWRRRQRQARILAELHRLAAETGDGPALTAAVSALLKRAALARYPREQVAALTGAAWLDWLDRTGGAGGFCDGPGRVLADGPYAPASAGFDREGFDRAGLLALCRTWLERNTG